MTTEIRAYGDGKQIVVYTTQPKVAARLAHFVSLMRTVEYQQYRVKEGPGNWPTIGSDFYFPKVQEGRLRRELGLPDQPRVASLRQAPPTVKSSTGVTQRGKYQRKTPVASAAKG